MDRIDHEKCPHLLKMTTHRYNRLNPQSSGISVPQFMRTVFVFISLRLAFSISFWCLFSVFILCCSLTYERNA